MKLLSLLVVLSWFPCGTIVLPSSNGVELINNLKKNAYFRKKNRGISVHALEQSFYNIQESTKSRNAAYFFKSFHRIRKANQKSVIKSIGIKSKGFFTQTSLIFFCNNCELTVRFEIVSVFKWWFIHFRRMPTAFYKVRKPRIPKLGQSVRSSGTMLLLQQ